MLLSVARVARHLKRERIDVVHAHLPLAGVVARLAGRLAGVPVVYTEHNPPDSYHPLTQRLSRLTWRLQARAIAISPDVARAIARHTPARVPVETVLNGVDTDHFRRSGASAAEVRRRVGVPPEAPVVGTVGMFRRQKRYDVWLAAAARLRESVPEVQFLIVGDGEERAEMEALAARIGMADRVLFAGVHADVRPYLEAMDVFLMSSDYEGFGLAPAEALALEVPVVATAVDGIRSVLDEGATLVPLGTDTAERLAAEVGRLLTDAGARARAGAAGRRDVVRRLGLVRMQRELEALYDRVHAEARARTSRAQP